MCDASLWKKKQNKIVENMEEYRSLSTGVMSVVRRPRRHVELIKCEEFRGQIDHR